MIVRAFVISEVRADGTEFVVAVRLSYKSAREIAKLKGNRKIENFIANKEVLLSDEDSKRLLKNIDNQTA